MRRLNISVVNYLNSKVFVKGLIPHAENDFNISLDIPSICASKLINDTVDIGLIPVGVIPEVQNANIVSDYCISTTGAVNSVFLFSNSPLSNLHTIYLDTHSRTSNLLCKVLSKECWKIQVVFKPREQNIIDLKEGEGMVLIGDRTFDQIGKYSNTFDLSEEWEKLTGLPFVFAAWVANKEISLTDINLFNQFLSNGFNHLDEVIEENKLDYFDVNDYLKNRIEYKLNDKKRTAISLFLEKSKNL